MENYKVEKSVNLIISGKKQKNVEKNGKWKKVEKYY